MSLLKKVFNKYKIVKVLIALFLLTWLVKSGRLDFYPLLSTRLSIFHLMGMAVLLVSLLVQGLRWWCLLRTQGLHLPLLKTIHLVWIGQFFSLVLPGMAGGELARGYYIVQEASDAKTAVLSTVVVDRVMGLYSLLCLGIVSLLYLLGSQNQLSSSIIQLGVSNLLLFSGISLLFLAVWIHPARRLLLRLVPGRFRPPMESTLNS